MSAGQSAFAPVAAVMLMGFAIYSLWTGEIRLRGGIARRDESPIRFWLFVSACLFLSVMGGISAVVAWRAAVLAGGTP